MANVKFYLDKRPRAKAKKVPIFLSFSYKSKRFFFRLGITASLDSWDLETSRIKKNFNEAKHINPILDLYESKLMHIVGEMQLAAVANNQPYPSLEEIKKAFLNSVQNHTQKPKKKSKPKAKKSFKRSAPPKLTILKLFNEFLKEKAHTHTEGTLKIFRRVRNRLSDFAEKTGASLEVNNIDVKFQRAYVNYLIEEFQHSNATIGTEIRKIHAVLNHYSEEHSNNSFRKFKAPSYESKRFICTYDEILKLYEFEPLKEHLLRARDCCVFSFFTGLSFVDLCNLRESNLIEDTLNGEKITIIDFKRQKTKKYNQIPLNSICLEILERWKGKQRSGQLLPVYEYDQTMNKFLHELLQASGLFDREVEKVKESGKRRIVTRLPRWKAITFHSFRHGYASHLAREDVNPVIIQKLMGHSKLETTMIYIQTNRKKVFEAALDKLEK